MDIRKIRKLIELLEETGISEIEIKEEKEGGGVESLRLSRHSSAPNQPPQIHYMSAPQQPSVAPMPSPASVLLPPATAPMAEHHKHTAAVPTLAGHKICSPMVGTMYTSPSPETPPFVTLGQTVKMGDTLCIVEAMKMFNEIEADKEGKIIEILVANGDPVEYNQALFIIE